MEGSRDGKHKLPIHFLALPRSVCFLPKSSLGLRPNYIGVDDDDGVRIRLRRNKTVSILRTKFAFVPAQGTNLNFIVTKTRFKIISCEREIVKKVPLEVKRVSVNSVNHRGTTRTEPRPDPHLFRYFQFVNASKSFRSVPDRSLISVRLSESGSKVLYNQ